MKNSVLMTTLAVSIAAGSIAAGYERGADGHGPRHSFETLDINNDGRITPQEMGAHMDARFDKADLNGDGLVSADELRTRMQKRDTERMDRRISKMMQRHDANGDGLLNKDEMKSKRLNRMMKFVDENGDGSISKSEFENMQQKRDARRKAKKAE